MNSDRLSDTAPRALLCVIDESPEVRKALYFAAFRALRTGANIITLASLPPETGGSEFLWGGISKLAEDEKRDAVTKLCEEFEREIFTPHGLTPVRLVSEGDPVSLIREKIAAHQEIKEVILAAGGSENPGPLVEKLTRGAAKIKIPLTVIPANMTEEDIERTA